MLTELALVGLAFLNISHNWEFFDFVGNDGKSFVGSENQKFLSWYCLLWLSWDFWHSAQNKYI
jgi:hypothetical protein